MRSLTLTILLAATGSLAGGCSDSIPPTQPNELDSIRPVLRMDPRVDGTMRGGEWKGAEALSFMMNAPEGLVPAVLLAKSSTTTLYLAVRIDRGAEGDPVFGHVYFDNDRDGVGFETGEDLLAFLGFPGTPWIFSDLHWGETSSTLDTDRGGTSDGEVAVGSTRTSTTIELTHPLDSGDGFDVSLTLASPETGVSLFLSLPLRGGLNPTAPGLSTQTTVASVGAFCGLKAVPATAFTGCPSGLVASVRVLPDPTAAVVAPVTLLVNQSHQLGLQTYDYLGNNLTASSTCFWSSSNTAVAQVDGSGRVQTVSPGEAVILATCQTALSSLFVEGRLKVIVS